MNKYENMLIASKIDKVFEKNNVSPPERLQILMILSLYTLDELYDDQSGKIALELYLDAHIESFKKLKEFRSSQSSTTH